MLRLVTGEFRKLLTTRLWLWLLLAAVAVTVLYAALDIAFADRSNTFTLPLNTVPGQRTLLAVGAAGAPMVAVLGAIGLTAEFRHRTATTTFLTTPARGRIVAAKLVAYAVVGIVYGLIAVTVTVTVAIALPWLDAKHIHLVLGMGTATATIGGALAAMALYALIGIGLGALLREQVATVVVLLAYLFLVERTLTSVHALNSVTLYLPGQALEALVGSTLTNQPLLAPWLGGLLLAGYAVVAAAAGTRLAMTGDVT